MNSNNPLPQLPNSIFQADAVALLLNPDYCLQEKIDGRRTIIAKRDGQIMAFSRLGSEVSIPTAIVQAALALPGDFILDGERKGDVFHAFDRIDDPARPFSARFASLADLLAISQS